MKNGVSEAQALARAQDTINDREPILTKTEPPMEKSPTRPARFTEAPVPPVAKRSLERSTTHMPENFQTPLVSERKTENEPREDKEHDDVINILNSLQGNTVTDVLRKSIELVNRRSQSPTPDRDSSQNSYLHSMRKLFDQMKSVGVTSIGDRFFTESF